MRVARLRENDGEVSFAELEGEVGHVLHGVPWIDGVRRTGRRVTLASAALACPVAPSKILCIGRNYAAHAKELGHEVPAEPLVFLKPPSSLIGPGVEVVLPPESARVEHEAELGVVIGRRARRLAREDALAHVFGFTAVADVTARDLQKKDGQWSRAKGFDTFCPVGPWIETELDVGDLAIACRVNGATRQQGRTSQMIFDVPALLAHVSAAMTLEPGDLLVTGTPEGVGPLADGDQLEIDVEGIGVLAVRVRSERRGRGTGDPATAPREPST